MPVRCVPKDLSHGALPTVLYLDLLNESRENADLPCRSEMLDSGAAGPSGVSKDSALLCLTSLCHSLCFGRKTASATLVDSGETHRSVPRSFSARDDLAEPDRFL